MALVRLKDQCFHLPADTVHVGVGIEREVKVDDVSYVLEVNPSRDTRFFVLLPPVRREGTRLFDNTTIIIQYLFKGVNISERKSGMQRTKKRKMREIVCFPTTRGHTWYRSTSYRRYTDFETLKQAKHRILQK